MKMGGQPPKPPGVYRIPAMMRWFDIGSRSDNDECPCGATQFALRKRTCAGNNQINKPTKGLRLGIYSTVAFALLALGYGLWPDAGQNGLKKDADTILRGVPANPAPLNTAVTTNSSPHRGAVTLADSNPVVVDPQGAAQSIVAHGQDLQEENRKIRASLAAGDISALPDSLKVADLPLSTPPPRPVASRPGS